MINETLIEPIPEEDVEDLELTATELAEIQEALMSHLRSSMARIRRIASTAHAQGGPSVEAPLAWATKAPSPGASLCSQELIGAELQHKLRTLI